LLESSQWDDSNKWTNIGFGEEIGIIDVKKRSLSGALKQCRHEPFQSSRCVCHYSGQDFTDTETLKIYKHILFTVNNILNAWKCVFKYLGLYCLQFLNLKLGLNVIMIVHLSVPKYMYINT